MKLTGKTLVLSTALALAISVVSGAAQAETMILASPQAPEGFDGDALKAHTQNVVTQVYENLVTYGKMEVDGVTMLNPDDLQPHLAESWTVSEDGKTWVFKLREGVLSPYGNELSAEDVAWGWAKSFDQKRTGNFIARVSNVESVKALSQYEVEFTLSAPSAIFLNALTLYVPAIYDTTEVKKHVTEDDPWALEWMQSNTAGYGAYHLDQLRADDQAVFVSNPNYFGGESYYDRVIYKEIPSEASRVTLLKAGQVQWIDRPSIQKVVDMQADKNVKVERATSRSVAAARMNPTCEVFSDKRVRQAFNYAVDKDALNTAVFAGQADIAKSIVSPIIAGSKQEYFAYDYDPEKAKALLAEAGYPDGISEPVELLYSDAFWHQEPVAIQVTDMLKKVGINAVPTRITSSEMRARAAPAVQDMCFFTWEDGPIVLDAVYSMYLMTHSEGVSNRAKYLNPELDVLIDAAREELDTDKRMALMDEAQKLWAEDAPWILVTYPATFEAMAPNVSGWVYYPDEHERWRELRGD
ncbi:ABC transporter substrate-binding protein [Puniceibacterium sp. IMCC21224]|uniref:ABC transporter substrate-binding protein n=1 Tax=Puniceibacterium sp. IMCC21224 TaxID=1618204 RepID=UPI00064DB7BE|nr:ABC transporter substrate-binding protein [Puniceibacterium sp. IMCC21224]KMK64902.1 ABC-type dipeptide transport system, periplasmic component [Puniceibacterium sp. IMCC21224]